MTATVETAKYRVRRRFYDRVSGRVYDSLAAIPRALEPDPLAIRACSRVGPSAQSNRNAASGLNG